MNVCIILLIYILIANAVAILNRGKIKTQRFSCISPWNKMLLHRIAILGDVTRCLASSNKNIFTNFFLRPCISHETKAVKNQTVRNRCIFTIFQTLIFLSNERCWKQNHHHYISQFFSNSEWGFVFAISLWWPVTNSLYTSKGLAWQVHL